MTTLTLEEVLKKHTDVSKEELGTVNGWRSKWIPGCTATIFPSLPNITAIETESGEGTRESGSRQGHQTSAVF